MQTSKHLAKHFREVIFGKNWTWSNLKDGIAEISWDQATQKIESFNTIFALVFHIHYYIEATLKVLEGGPLDAKDEFSFDTPVFSSEEEWQGFLQQVWEDSERFAQVVEQLPEEKLWETFSAEKYGNYYRNIQGVIEHTHYHLGQIVVLKKLL